MGARLRSWWQQIKQHRVAIGVVGVGLVAVIMLFIVSYLFDWTGFNGYNKVTIAHTISGTNAGTVTKTEEYQPGKTLWDWLQLLIIPAVLAVGGYLFNYTTSKNEQQSTQLRDQTERDIALDNQQEAALQGYIDKLSELLLEKQLRESKPGDEVRNISRVRTLTVLPRLDNKRKRSVLQFLHESGLIDKGISITDLDGADLSKADLYGANLIGADLSKANLGRANLGRANLVGDDLIEADLYGADLSNADLREAKLSDAKLSGADLREASLLVANLSKVNLSRANLGGASVTPEQLSQAFSLKDTILPDGSKHSG